ncbi:MAG: ATP synthase F1 subunit delta [Wolbachia sp.]|nr:ATP synthase F1 subunit delta [Wolbachia sp.]MDD9336530.1 ATP synthase F1 subunit delta [Wolbachia sp.]
MKKTQYNNLVASYAKALFCIAEGKLDVMRKEVEFLLDFFENQRDIFMYLSDPMISVARKEEVILCMKEYLSESLIRFIMVAFVNKRFYLLLSILEKFLSFVREDKNEFSIIIKSAKPLKEPEIKIITESLSFLGKIKKTSNIVDSSILGGFIIRYGFNLIDASLKSYLDRLVDLSKTEILKYSEQKDFV